MVDAVRAAQEAARKAQESLYSGVMTVTEHQKMRDDVSKLTDYEDVKVLENQPCRLSFQTLKQASSSESAVAVTQVIKLFLSPDIVIRPGSRITVTQDGVTADYAYSGIPAAYPTHQEIILDRFERWA